MAASSASIPACLLALLMAVACAPAPSPQPTAVAIPSATRAPTAAATAASVPTSTPPAAPSATPACEINGPWNLELHLSGGFAGVERRLEVDQSGAYEARDEQSGRSAEGLVPGDVLDEISGELPSLCSAPPQARPPTCADCFVYLLQGTVNGARIEMSFNDLNLAEHPAGTLVGTLAGFLTRALGG